MINCGYSTKENIEKHDLNWPQILDHLYKIWKNGDSRSGKRNVLLNLIKQQNEDDYNVTDKIHFEFCRVPNTRQDTVFNPI